MRTELTFAMGEINRNNEMKVFDWDKAVELIKEHKIANAQAGLAGDLEWTAGAILDSGEPVFDSYTYLSSTWATPLLIDEDTGKEYECWVWESQTEYNEDTKWPESALKKLCKPTLARGEDCANRPVSELRDEIVAAISQILETEDLKPGNEANLRKILKEMKK